MSRFLFKTFLIIFCLFSIANCSINPTAPGTKDFRRDYTLEIVKKTNCEARDAMVLAASKIIGSYSSFEGATSLASKLEENPGFIRKVSPWEIDPAAMVRTNLLVGAGIGMKFVLTGMESNTNTISPTFLASGGTNNVSLGVSSHSAALTRKNARTLTEVKSTFAPYQNLECYYDGDASKTEKERAIDWIFPLRGNINLAKTINGFIDYVLLYTNPSQRNKWAEDAIRAAAKSSTKSIWKSADRVRVLAKDIKAGCGGNENTCNTAKVCYEKIILRSSAAYAISFYEKTKKKASSLSWNDVLTFTTAFSGGANPSLTIGDASGSFKLSALGLGFANSRTDTHELTVALTAMSKPEKPSADPIETVIGSVKDTQFVLRVPGDKIEPVESVDECMEYITITAPKSIQRKVHDGKRRKVAKFTSSPGPFIVRKMDDEEDKAITNNLEIRLANPTGESDASRLRRLENQ